MRKTRVVFQTKPVSVAPDKKGPFAGCPQTKCMTYVRFFNLDPNKFDVVPPHDKIKFYGDEYKIISIGEPHGDRRSCHGGRVSPLPHKAKAAGHRWKAKSREQGRCQVGHPASRLPDGSSLASFPLDRHRVCSSGFCFYIAVRTSSTQRSMSLTEMCRHIIRVWAELLVFRTFQLTWRIPDASYERVYTPSHSHGDCGDKDCSSF